jgi:hypothetical protein
VVLNVDVGKNVNEREEMGEIAKINKRDKGNS